MTSQQIPANNTLEKMPDDIILFTQRGYQTAASVSQFQPQIDGMTEQLHKEGKKALILVDMTNVSGHEPQAREEGKKRINGDYDALAICGSDVAMQMIVNWLIRLSGSGNRIQFFETREQALDWLHKH